MGSAQPTQGEIWAANQKEHPTLEMAAARLGELLPLLLDEINFHHIDARAKGVDSFCAKAMTLKDNGERKYADPLKRVADDASEKIITDQVAARVITYLPETVDDVCKTLGEEFIVTENVDKGERMRQEGKFGYASRHLLLQLSPERACHAEYKSLKDLTFEVQVRTVVQHAWAEFEHDVRYKFEIPPDKKPRFDRSFALAAALLEMADREFTVINDLYQELARGAAEQAESVDDAPVLAEPKVPERYIEERPHRRSEGVRITADAIPALLARRYPDATRSRKEHYATIVSVLANLGIGTSEQLDRALARIDSEAVAQAMDHKLPAGHVRRLEDDLLCAYGERYFTASEVPGLSGRKAILRGRLKKMRSLR